MNVEVLRALVAKWRAEIQERGGCGCGCYGKSAMQRQCADDLDQALEAAEAEMLALRPDAHRHLSVAQSYAILAGLFADVQESHSILSRRGRVLGDRLPERIALLCQRAEAGDRDRRAMEAVRAALSAFEAGR